MDITERPRRLRSTPEIRALVRENSIAASSLILPIFIREGLTEPVPIPGMPGVVQHTTKSLEEELSKALAAGIGGVMLFGIPERRDADGTEALNPEGVLSRAVRQARAQAGNNLVSHSHCGVLDAEGRVDNDRTLEIYAAFAGVLADAGAHMVGTSGMMDGQVGAVRRHLDSINRSDVLILAYAAKFASAFYGPFRDAVESQLIGDRKSYQQDPANRKDSLREIRLDVAEGADIIMVKPTLAYLDILAAASQIVDVPTAAYIVSGEMAMLESAAAQGFVDRERGIMEIMASIRRAGASVICTYWALEVARFIKEGSS
jgi:porphobilinogen synthase